MPSADRLPDRVKILVHEVLIMLAAVEILPRDIVAGLQHNRLCAGRFTDGIGDLLRGILQIEDRADVLILDLRDERGERCRGSVGVAAAPGECGVIFLAVGICEIAEREAVGKDQRVGFRVLPDRLCFRVQRSELFVQRIICLIAFC